MRIREYRIRGIIFFPFLSLLERGNDEIFNRRFFYRETIVSYRNRNARDTSRIDIDADNNDRRIKRESSDLSSASDVTKDFNHNEIDPKVITATYDDALFYDLSEGDLCNLFKLEISPSNTEEIEQGINRIKLEEEMAPTNKATKRERGQGDGSIVFETGTVKYMEAEGEIEFTRKYWKRGKGSLYSYTYLLTLEVTSSRLNVQSSFRNFIALPRANEHR